MARKVLIPTKLDAAAGDLLRANDFDVVQDANTPFADLVAAHPDAVALIVRSEEVTSSVINALPQLKLIVRAGAGYNTIDIKYARRKDIDVMNTPGANSNAVAEEVIALILAAYRHIIAGDASTRAGQWEKKALMGRELAGKTVGVVGLGNIGQLLVKRLSGFECRVIGYDPVMSRARADALGVELMGLEDIFAESDIVSLHVPETAETKGMINRALLERMKTGAMLVNCARSGVLNEDDFRALKASKKLVFCNDVYAKDAAGPKSVEDIADIMLPHLGASTSEANFNAARRAAEQTVSYFLHGVTKFVVNQAVPEGLDQGYQLLAYYLIRVARAYLGKDKQPRRIEVSLYGDLKQYENWLVAPIVLGLSSEFDPLFDYQHAAAYLEEKGITFVSREVDNRKNYGNTITIDLMEGDGRQYAQVGVRGTMAEGNPIISRIDDFDKLYLEPIGNNVLVTYQDQPGMLAKITGVFGRHGINIDDIRSPHDSRTGESMAVLKTNQPVSDAVLNEVLAESGARQAVTFSL